jgi:hypothetical protein
VADRYLIVSDLHLCDVEENPDGWKYFKSSRYRVDRDFAELIDFFVSGGCEDDVNTLVLNGDLFDFDLVTALPGAPPWRVKLSERRGGLEATPEKSQWKLDRILGDHPLFLEALTGFIGLGGRVVYVLGNHDREMHFEGMQAALVEALRGRLRASGRADIEPSVDFEPWFYHVPGVLYAEHGNQYDPFTSYRDILSPVIVVDGEERLALPMGNLSNRRMLSRMGCFNPFSGDYIKTGFSYLVLWLRHYAFSKRSLASSWLWGSISVLVTLMVTRWRESKLPRDVTAQLEDLADGARLSAEQLIALLELHAAPIYQRSYRVLRELWLDRLLIWIASAGAIVAIALTDWPLWLKLAIPLMVIPAAYQIYERIAGKEAVFDVQKRIPQCAAAIAELLDVPLVTFGHDHLPRVIELAGGASFYDSGTWAPITQDEDSRTLSPGYRNFLLVVAAEGRPQVHFSSWPLEASPHEESSREDLRLQSSVPSCA